MKGHSLKALLVLEDGTVFPGTSFGAPGETFGEVVFNTSLSGYQEILTDPSYKGQVVTMTYPLIGNYGVNEEDVEAVKPWVEGFVVKECSKIVSNFRASMSLPDYLKKHGIMGIEGVDTRALTKHIRLQGAMKCVISTEDDDVESLAAKAKASQGLVGVDLVKDVTCSEPFEWAENGDNKKLYNVVVLDCGVKFNILRRLDDRDCKLTVVPASTSAKDILALKPDGVMLSNGPGDPEGIMYVVGTVKELLDAGVPMFGICMGHHMATMALGGKIYKLKFGHHGGNHPVKDTETGKIAISVQNHGFCCDIGSLPADDVEISHVNCNDDTLEGIRHKKLPLFAVQFHPEAGPGPHDATYLFDNFITLMKEHKK